MQLLFKNNRNVIQPVYVTVCLIWLASAKWQMNSAKWNALAMPLNSQALKYVCNQSNGMAKRHGRGDVETRELKSSSRNEQCQLLNSWSKSLTGMQEVWHATQRFVPSGNHGYICNLECSPSETRAASEILWERQCPRHHTDKCLSSVKSRWATVNT